MVPDSRLEVQTRFPYTDSMKITERAFEKKHKRLWAEYMKASKKAIKLTMEADRARDEAHTLHTKVWKLEAEYADQ